MFQGLGSRSDSGSDGGRRTGYPGVPGGGVDGVFGLGPGLGFRVV